MSRLGGQCAVVTGASSGIGRAIAERLAAEGVTVAAVARRSGPLSLLADAASARGERIVPIRADVATAEGTSAVLAALHRDGLEPDVLVNAAGTFGPISRVGDGDPEAWLAALHTNIDGTFRMCAALVPGMVARGRGLILTASSAASLVIGGGNSSYGTSKSAINHFTRQLAVELEGTGVAADVFHPGDVRTEMFDDIRTTVEGAGPAGAAYAEWVRLMDATGGDSIEKAADLVVAIASADERPNGRFLWIDGGITAPLPTWD